jgi:nucleotide-binding universal stress UspA family protein
MISPYRHFSVAAYGVFKPESFHIMKTILVPTDFSANANTAVQYAAHLAAQIKSSIILFHSVPVQVAVAEVPAWYEPEQGLLEYYEFKLAKEAKQLRLENGYRFEVEVVCRKGSLSQNLNDLIQEKEVDLVVMGFKGASSWLDKLIGTVTSSFIKETVCPVLIVPSQVTPALPWRVAYAADFEHKEQVFLNQLLSVTAPLKAQVFIVHVQTKEQVDLAVEDQALEDISQAFPGNDFAFAEIRQQDVAAGLEAFVAENRMDVLALASRERSFLEDLFHTSITDRLAIHPSVPLLVIPEHPYRLSNNFQSHQEATLT